MLVVELGERERIDLVCRKLNDILKEKNPVPNRQFTEDLGDFPPLYTQEVS